MPEAYEIKDIEEKVILVGVSEQEAAQPLPVR